MDTRTKTEIYLLGQPSTEFPAGLLPTLRDVLSFMIAVKKEKGKMFPVEKIVGCTQLKGSKELTCNESGGCLTGEDPTRSPCLVAKLKLMWSEAGLSVISGAAVKRRLNSI